MGVVPAFAHLGLHGLGVEGPLDLLHDDGAELAARCLGNGAGEQFISQRLLALLQVILKRFLKCRTRGILEIDTTLTEKPATPIRKVEWSALSKVVQWAPRQLAEDHRR